MSVLSLYIFRQIAQIFLILLAVFTGLVWVSQAIRFLNLVIEKGRSLGEFLILTGYIIPSIMGLVAPTALFVATIFVLFRLNSDSELAVVQAAGGSQWSLLRPFVAATALVTAFVIFVNLYAMPHGMRAFREKLISVRTDLISTLVQEGQFVSPESGLTVHIRAQDKNGDLLGLLFHDTRKDDARITYLAERARIVSDENGTSLVMFNGTFQRRRETAKDVDVVRFKEYTLDLDTFGPDRKVPYYQASEKFMSELLNPDPKDPVFLDKPGNIVAELHERLSNPLYVFTMMLIAFAGLSEANTNRLGRVWIIMGVLFAATAVRLVGATAVNLLTKNSSLYPLAYAIPLVAILSTLTYLAVHNRASRRYYAMARNRASRHESSARRGYSAPVPAIRPAPAEVPRSARMPEPQDRSAKMRAQVPTVRANPPAARNLPHANPVNSPDPHLALRHLSTIRPASGPPLRQTQGKVARQPRPDPRQDMDRKPDPQPTVHSNSPRGPAGLRPPSMVTQRPPRRPNSKPDKRPA